MSDVVAHGGTQPVAHLLALPPELRTLIYELVPVHKSRSGDGSMYTEGLIHIDTTEEAETCQPAITQVCRIVRQETLPLFYGRNLWECIVDPRDAWDGKPYDQRDWYTANAAHLRLVKRFSVLAGDDYYKRQYTIVRDSAPGERLHYTVTLKILSWGFPDINHDPTDTVQYFIDEGRAFDVECLELIRDVTKPYMWLFKAASYHQGSR